jgi:ArsR family transcriptional regulator
LRIRKNAPLDAALNDEDVLAAAKISDALAHPVRIRMLRHIWAENFARRIVTNKDLVIAFDYSQATVSQHLSKLVIGGLLEVQKKGTSSCYFARIGKLSTYMDTLKKIEVHGDKSEVPAFLRAEYYESGDEGSGLPGELHPEDFETLADDDFPDAPRYL